MARRQDGRVEPGQSLKSAVSARAWNRAQDAADIVLGDRTGFGAEGGLREPGRLVVPCRVTTGVQNVGVGYVVKITQAGAKAIPSPSNQSDKRAPSVFSFQGNVVVPVTQDNYEDAKVQLGVIVGGATFPRPGTPAVVNVCIAGMCVARVRSRGGTFSGDGPGPYPFMSAPIKRTTADTDAKLTGAGEASTCGSHRIVQYLGNADAEGFLKFAAVLM